MSPLSHVHTRFLCPIQVFSDSPVFSTSKASHCPQGLSVADLLARLQVKREVFWRLKQEDDGGAQVELAQVLALAHADALLVVVGDVAEVVEGAFAVAREVCAQLLKRERERERERAQ